MISDLRFSLGRHVRLISFLRHIGEGIEPPPSLRGDGAKRSVSSRAETDSDSPQSLET